jgi:hypothetical protein
MAKYFSKFPQVFYNLTNQNELNVVTNITSRFRIEEKLKRNISSYFLYTIIDGDTPEIVAHKLYNSSERHWIILAMNDIVDPYYDWPLAYREFSKFVETKYSTLQYSNKEVTGVTGLEWANFNVHSYYKKETTTVDSESNVIETLISQQDYLLVAPYETTFNYLDGSSAHYSLEKYSLTYYDYENKQNENKRVIKILKPEFVSSIEQELRSVFL